MKLTLKQGLIFIVLLLIAQTLQAADSIGKVSFVRGSVAAISAAKQTRLLGKNDPVYQGDNLQTSAQSFIIIVFNDGAKITIRPDSSFSINQYINQQDKQIAKMELHKGGIRASNGEIAQDDPKKFQIKTPLATVNAQQAQYSVRLCQHECEEEAKKLVDKKLITTKLVIARVAQIQGKVTAKNSKPQSKTRPLVIGSPLYTGDYLSSQNASYAVLAFRDGGRITLDEKTEYLISNYQYQQQHQENKFIHKLIVGGLRVLTGYIGKVNKENYKINTPVATIGIRGTGFDLDYIDKCRQIFKKKYCKPAKGLYSYVWKGSIHQQNNVDSAILNAPDSNFIADENSPIEKLSQSPIKDRPIRPDKIFIDQDNLFKTHILDGTPLGLYVTVHDGYVRLGLSELDLGKNETAYVGEDNKMIRLDLQNFQEYDIYPLPSEFGEGQAGLGQYSLLNDNYGTASSAVYECRFE